MMIAGPEEAFMAWAVTKGITAVKSGKTLVLKSGNKTIPDAQAKQLVQEFNRSVQTLGRPASSSVLGKNLEAVSGVTRPANSAAHHIVAGCDPRAAQARAILRREGIDINEASNGVFLPSKSSVARPPATTHSRVHTDRYYREVEQRLRNAAPGTVRTELERIESELLNGTFPF